MRKMTLAIVATLLFGMAAEACNRGARSGRRAYSYSSSTTTSKTTTTGSTVPMVMPGPGPSTAPCPNGCPAPAAAPKMGSKTSSTTTTTTTTKTVQADALDEVNALRAARGLRPFLRDEALTQGALACAAHRAARFLFGHTNNDFAFLPRGAFARAGGCAAYHASYGWMSCAVYDNATYAGAAYVTGADGKRYMHLFIR